MTVAAIAGTIVPKVNVELGKALSFEKPQEEWMESVQEIDVTSLESNTARFPLFQATRLPSAKAPGAAAKRSNFTNYFQDMTFTTASKEHGWTEELKQDLPNFDLHVRERATEAAQVYAEYLYQWRTSIMTGTAVDDDLPVIDTDSYDGQAMYSSSTRWRTAGGNIISNGSGMTGPGIRTDFFRAIARMASYRHDLSNAKLWNRPETLRYLVEFHADYFQQMVEAFNAETVVQAGGSTQSADNQFLAFAKVKGAKVVLQSNNYLSGADWFGTVLGAPGRKAMLLGKKDEAAAMPLTMANSTEMLRTYAEAIVMHGRYGMVPGFTPSTFKVDN